VSPRILRLCALSATAGLAIGCGGDGASGADGAVAGSPGTGGAGTGCALGTSQCGTDWYEDLNSRTHLVREAHGHFYNDYCSQILSTGINSRNGATLLIEGN